MPFESTWISAPASLSTCSARGGRCEPSRRHDLPVGAAGQDAAVELRAGHRPAQNVHHAAMAERRGRRDRECSPASQRMEKIGSREIMTAPCVFSWPPCRCRARCCKLWPRSGRTSGRHYNEPPGMNVQGSVRAQADRRRGVPPRARRARRRLSSSPIRARIFRRSSRRSRARAAATRSCRARCWCRTRTSRSRWRTAPIRMTGRPQAVMVHVNVGTGNTHQQPDQPRRATACR